MGKWNGFEKMIEGLDMSDAIEAFFDRAEEIGFSNETLLAGVDYLQQKGRIIIARLISMEVMLGGLVSESNYRSEDLNVVVVAFAELKELMDKIDHQNKEQVLECLEDLREEYPEIFTILDEGGHA